MHGAEIEDNRVRLGDAEKLLGPKLSWRGNVANQVTVGAAVVEGSYQGVEEQNDAFEEEELLSLKRLRLKTIEFGLETPKSFVLASLS